MGEREPGVNSGIMDFFKNLTRKPSSLWVLLGLAAAGVLLLMSSTPENPNGSMAPVVNQTQASGLDQPDPGSVEAQLEKDLTSTLSAIAGVGKVRVKLNLKSKHRKIWERQAQINKRTSQEDGTVNVQEESNDQLVFARSENGGDQPVLKEELAPEIQGVIVIAAGADDVTIKQLLTTTVVTILDIPPHRVIVLPGEFKGGALE